MIWSAHKRKTKCATLEGDYIFFITHLYILVHAEVGNTFENWFSVQIFFQKTLSREKNVWTTQDVFLV